MHVAMDCKLLPASGAICLFHSPLSSHRLEQGLPVVGTAPIFVASEANQESVDLRQQADQEPRATSLPTGWESFPGISQFSALKISPVQS